MVKFPGRFLKAMKPSTKCILADPIGSIFGEFVRSSRVTKPGKKFLVEGVGKGTIPRCLDADVIDDVIEVTDKESFTMCHQLARKEGLMVGGSAGLNTFAAIKLANEMKVIKSTILLTHQAPADSWSLVSHLVSVRPSDNQNNAKTLKQNTRQSQMKPGLLIYSYFILYLNICIYFLYFQEPAVIVTVLCDLGIKYLTKIFNADWLKENNITIDLWTMATW